MLRISWSTQTTALGDGGDLESRSYEHTLEFDAVTSETHEGLAVLTEHAVESGAPLADHKRQNPRRVSIEAVVTNTPLGPPPPSGYGHSDNVTAEVRASANSTASAVVVHFSATFDRMADAWLTLDRLLSEDTMVTLSTAKKTYENVQIVGVTVPREAEDGDSIRFQIEIQEVRVAQSRTVDSPQPREARGASARDRGGQEAQDESRRVSTIAAARDGYAARREAGESRTDAALGAMGDAFAPGGGA